PGGRCQRRRPGAGSLGRRHGASRRSRPPSPHPSREPRATRKECPVAESRLDAVINLAKRRGFVFPSGEIYGGTRSAWDYGPLGVAIKENIARQWWRAVVTSREDVVGLDSSIILPKQVWVAS